MTLTGLVFLFVFFAALVLAFVRHPLFGLFAYISVFYLHPPSRWWGASLPELRWSFVAAVVTLIAMLFHRPPAGERQRWFSTTAAKIMIAFSIWFWVETAWAKDFNLHYEAAVLVTKYVLVYWIIYRLIDTPTKVTAFLLAHLLGCFYLGALGYTADYSGRLDGVGGPGIDDSNTLGMHLATGVIVGAMLLLKFRGWRLLGCVIAIAFVLNTVVMTGSRGAFLSLVAGAAVLVYLRPRTLTRAFYVYAALGLVLFGYVASQNFWSRISTVTTAVEDSSSIDLSAESRIEMLKAQVKMAMENPFGAGQRGSEILSYRYLDPMYMSRAADYSAGAGRSSHNAFMTVLVEQGIPGIVLFFAMVIWIISSVRKLKRQACLRAEPLQAIHLGAIAGALMVVFVGGMFADFSKCEVQIWMVALLACIGQESMYSTLPPDEPVASVRVANTPLTGVQARR